MDPPTVEFTCKARHIARLIGPRGATIRSLEQATGARINVDKVVLFNETSAGSEGGDVVITIAGNQAAVGAAETRVRSLVIPRVQHVACPKELAGALIGDHGQHIDAVREVGLEPAVSAPA